MYNIKKDIENYSLGLILLFRKMDWTWPLNNMYLVLFQGKVYWKFLMQKYHLHGSISSYIIRHKLFSSSLIEGSFGPDKYNLYCLKCVSDFFFASDSMCQLFFKLQKKVSLHFLWLATIAF